MNEKKDYQCEGCLALTPMRRIRCRYCIKLFCEDHIHNHNCKNMR
ncbi:hypothetical protein LCGC14_1492170 [marine sediment metagenome]|uniref:AN1-type domain-containing protein n=1 Tax=marine sediment metagenome TaxID=412755 RepID=A0A0F9LLX6_9ZZZZ